MMVQVIASYGGGIGEQSGVAVDGAEKGSQAVGPAPRKAPIGPAMPSPAMLAQAQQAAAQYILEVGGTYPFSRWGVVNEGLLFVSELPDGVI